MAAKYLHIECGTVLTRAQVVEVADQITILAAGEALTTVGYSGDDISIGALNAVRQAEEIYGRPIIDGTLPLRLHPESGLRDIIVTSGVAGAPVAAVAGVLRDISAESAQRAVLLGGGSVSDVFAFDDERLPHEKRVALKQQPIDLLLLAGGVDDQNGNGYVGRQAVTVAKLLAGGLPRSLSDPKNRPTVIYAGSIHSRQDVEAVFSGVAPFAVTENVRPAVESENLGPARVSVREQFERVTASSDRYRNMGARIQPSGYAVVRALEEMVRSQHQNTIIIDKGGAHTTVCSSMDGVLNRTVFDLNAEDRPSPSVRSGETIKLMERRGDFSAAVRDGRAKVELAPIIGVRPADAARWLPFAPGSVDVSALLGNRLVRPEAEPETWEDIAVMMAISREEIRIGLEHHGRLAVALRGVQQKRQISDVFDQKNAGGKSIIDLTRIENVILSGGWQERLTPTQTMLVAMDGLQMAGVSCVYRDANSILALLGSLMDLSEISGDVILRSLVPVGTCVAPIQHDVLGRNSSTAVTVENDRIHETLSVPVDTIARVALAPGETALITVSPPSGIDYGAGSGARVKREVIGGEVGLVIDTRRRPLRLPPTEDRRQACLLDWWRMLGVFPKETMASWQGGLRK